MNNTFNIKRFYRLFGKYTMEHLKANMMAIAVITGVLFIVLGFGAYSNRGYISVKIQVVNFMVFYLFSGSIFTSIIFSDLGDKRTAIPALTIPVSHFERFLVGWLYSYVFFQLIFIACFYAVDLIVIGMADSIGGVKNDVMDLFSMALKPYLVFAMYATVHAFLFLGAIYFEKLHFIKSAFAVFVFLILVMLINQPLTSVIFGFKADMLPPFMGARFHTGKELTFIEADGAASTVTYLTAAGIVLLLWTATYFRLKEKQV